MLQEDTIRSSLIDYPRFIQDLETLLAPFPGQDYFVSLAERIGKILQVDGVVIGELNPQGDFQPRAVVLNNETQDSLLLNESGSTFQWAVGQGQPVLLTDLADFDGDPWIQSNNFQTIYSIPLIGSFETVAGLIVLYQRNSIEDSDYIDKIFSFILARTVQEIERRQAEEILLESTAEIDSFSSCLKEIHRLNTTPFNNLTELFREYILAGCQMFQMSNGSIADCKDGKWNIIEYHFGSDDLSPKIFESEDTIAELLYSEGKTIIFSRHSDAPEAKSDCAMLKDYKIQKYIGVPISYGNSCKKVLEFYDINEDESNVAEHYTEIVELMASSLASEIERREAIETIHKLKNQQDGDYFLTSLLVHPLGETKITSINLEVTKLNNQYKKFSFNNHNSEIGGDLSAAYQIALRDNSYLAFVNSDAMGKSMQGAGGAIVLGALFRAFIERTKVSGFMSKLSPEQWLKEAFIDFHKVFESFDGCMMVSVVLGLIEEETGMCWFVNAEHPQMVLFRDGRARFTTSKFYYYKLGVPIANQRIAVTCFRLKKDDILILGSDGRDDLMLSGQIRNEDEELFLRIVEKSNGDLARIWESLLETGKITDDLSMLRIKYNREIEVPARLSSGILNQPLDAKLLSMSGEELVSLWNEEKLAAMISEARLIELYRTFYKAKLNGPLLECSLKLLKIRPNQSNRLYSVALAAYKYGDTNLAIDYGERLRLRSPSHLKNLILLAKIYYDSGERKKFSKFIEEIHTLAPENPGYLKLKKYTESR